MSTAALDLDAEAPHASAGPRRPWLIPFLALFVLQAGVILKSHGDLLAGMTDADTLMRLARIKYVLASHGWHEGFFPRDNAPYGMVLHWSILFDLPIIALTGLFSLFMPLDTALGYAGIFTGPVIAYAVLWAVWWAGGPALAPRTREFACLAVAVSPAPLGYGGIGRANHHIALVLMMVLIAGLALRAWTDRRSIRAPALMGIAAAVDAWLSFELVALAVAPAVLALGLLWIREGGSRLRQNLLFAGALALGMTVGLLIDPPYGGYGVFALDRLSIVHVAAGWLLLAGWGVLWLLWRRQTGRLSSRLTHGALIATGAAAILVALFPAVLAGVGGQIDPVVMREQLTKVKETQPAYADFNQFMQTAYLGCLGVAAALILIRHHFGKADIIEWVGLGAMAAGLTGLGIAHVRFAPYAAIAGAFLIAKLVEEAERTPERASGRYGRIVALIGALAIPFGVAYLPSGEADAANDSTQDCDVHAVKAALDDPAWFGTPVGIIASDIDSAPPLLFWTPHSTLFGPYHRNAQGLHDMLAIFRDTGDGAARRIVQARGIDAFLICRTHPPKMLLTPDGAEAGPKDDGPGTLFRRLADGHPPAWLKAQPWPGGVKSGYVFYKVDRTALAAAD